MSDTPSRWDDLLEIFTDPAAVFERRRDGEYGLALAVLTVATGVLFFATRSALEPVWDAEFARQMATAAAGNRELTAEQLEAGRRISSTFAGVFAVIGAPIAAFLLGLAVWIAGGLVGAPLNYGQGVTIGTFAMFPRLVEFVVNGFQGLLLDEGSITSRYSVTLGPGRFLDPDAVPAALLGVLGRIDAFTLWVTLLIGVGLAVMGRRSAGQAAAGAAIVWVLGATPVLLQAVFT